MKPDTQTKFFYNFLFYAFVLLAPFIYFIKFSVYGYIHLEVAMMMGLLILAALVLTTLEKLLGWLGQVIIFSLTLSFCISFLPGFKNNTTVFLSLLAFMTAHVFMDNRLRKILMVMSVVFITSTLIFPVYQQLVAPHEQPFETKKPIDNNLPPVIHLMLDEHAGISGIPLNIAQGKSLRQHLKHFYTHNGFHVYANAYSHYLRTFNSVSNLINFTSKPENHYYFRKPDDRPYVTANKYFKLMGEKGYRIRVYQFNSLINYCEPKKYPIESCYDYPAASLSSIKGLGISTKYKFLFMLKSYLLWSYSYQMLMGAYQYYLKPALAYIHINLPSWRWYQARTSALLIPDIFKQLAIDIKKHPQGTLFYAHILGPHNPYVFNASCQLIKNPMSWQISLSADPDMNTPATRIIRYTLYENQVRCVTKQVKMLVKRLKKDGIFKRAIIIVNGDHGSRISELLPAEKFRQQFTPQDYRDSFDAFFAVKMPGLSATTTYGTQPIQQLFAHVIEKITGKSIPITPSKPFGYMMTEGYNGVMQPLYKSNMPLSYPHTPDTQVKKQTLK